MRKIFATVLYQNPSATLDDLRKSVTTLEDIEPTARRVLGGSHPLTPKFERALQMARTVLGAREAGRRVVFRTPPTAAAPGSGGGATCARWGARWGARMACRWAVKSV